MTQISHRAVQAKAQQVHLFDSWQTEERADEYISWHRLGDRRDSGDDGALSWPLSSPDGNRDPGNLRRDLGRNKHAYSTRGRANAGRPWRGPVAPPTTGRHTSPR